MSTLFSVTHGTATTEELAALAAVLTTVLQTRSEHVGPRGAAGTSMSTGAGAVERRPDRWPAHRIAHSWQS